MIWCSKGKVLVSLLCAAQCVYNIYVETRLCRTPCDDVTISFFTLRIIEIGKPFFANLHTLNLDRTPKKLQFTPSSQRGYYIVYLFMYFTLCKLWNKFLKSLNLWKKIVSCISSFCKHTSNRNFLHTCDITNRRQIARGLSNSFIYS